MKKNNFIVTRFAEGSAGRFFSCCLQLSPNISSWNTNSLELDKNSKEFQQSMIDYFDACFPFDRLLHLRNEPDVPYVCDFYSGRYPRGEEVTLEEYINYQKKNKIDFYSIESGNNKFINLILHKSRVPNFLKGSIIINIVVDNQESHEIIAKLTWLKHYNVIDNSTVDFLVHNPNFGNKKRYNITRKFNNQSIIKVDNINEFYLNEVFNNKNLIRFKNKQLILEDQSNKYSKQEFVNFSDVIDSNKCLVEINRILEKNNLKKVASDETFILLHNNWLLKQKKMLKRFKI
jgi:hypothetical protein